MSGVHTDTAARSFFAILLCWEGLSFFYPPSVFLLYRRPVSRPLSSPVSFSFLQTSSETFFRFSSPPQRFALRVLPLPTPAELPPFFYRLAVEFSRFSKTTVWGSSGSQFFSVNFSCDSSSDLFSFFSRRAFLFFFLPKDGITCCHPGALVPFPLSFAVFFLT